MVLTYIVEGVVDGTNPLPGSERIMAELEKRGEPWRFGIEPDELDRYLGERGFELLEDVGAPDYRSRYLEPTGRKMDVFEGERVAVARVRNGDHGNMLDWRSS
jgi:O-methyltransferase involved in polyketide biosynthesis